MKKINKVLGILSLVTLSTTIFSCGGSKKDNGPSGQELADVVISKIILPQNNTDVVSNFDIAKLVKYEGITYEVDWSSSVVDYAKIEDKAGSDTMKTVKITRPEAGNENAEVKLTAKITVTEGATNYYGTKDFSIVVPALEAAPAIESIKALKEAIADATKYTSKNPYDTQFGDKELTVVGVLKDKGVIVADDTDMIYLFGKSYASDLKRGDNITISAASAYRYYGCPELVNATYNVVSHDNKNPIKAQTGVTVDSLYKQLEDAGFAANSLPVSCFSYIEVTGKIIIVEEKYVVLADPADETNQSKWLCAYNYNEDYSKLEAVAGKVVTINIHIHDVYSDFKWGGDTPASTVFRFNYFDGDVTVSE